MTRMNTLAALAAMALVVTSCGKDVIIDVDSLPAGNAAGVAASGTFDFNEVISSSDCPATAAGVTLPVETDTWTSTATLLQDEGYLKMDLAGGSGRPGFAMDGGIFWHGNFRLGGTYYYSGSSVTFINLMDGRFTEGVDGFEGTTTIRVQATDSTDCELTVEFTGTRR
ncbi:MAG: hypothetical protein JRG91_10565 [Deltaproteobacteria bacterium]|nr:hypothetical protein [Deltaproteobacteria bacterium]